MGRDIPMPSRNGVRESILGGTIRGKAYTHIYTPSILLGERDEEDREQMHLFLLIFPVFFCIERDGSMHKHASLQFLARWERSIYHMRFFLD